MHLYIFVFVFYHFFIPINQFYEKTLFFHEMTIHTRKRAYLYVFRTFILIRSALSLPIYFKKYDIFLHIPKNSEGYHFEYS